MRIGIFETTHFEGAYPVIRLFDNGTNEITVFTYEESYRQFQFLFGTELSKFNWIVKRQDESKYQFIKRISRETKARSLQLLYLNTVTDNFIFYAWMTGSLKNVRVIMTLHAINHFFQHKPTFSVRRIVRILGKKRLVRIVKEFNVVALTMVSYLKTKLPPNRRVHCVPGAVYGGQDLPTHNGKQITKIVIPGVVDERRRDYELVITLAEKLKSLSLGIQLVCLGGIHPDYGEKLLVKLKNEKNTGLIQFYEVNQVDQPEFDKQMDECDLVFVPSKINISIHDDIPEVYGQTMSSGNLFDIIKHAKPFLAPRNLKVDPFLEESCLRYETVEDIVEILVALNESPEMWKSVQEKALTASLHYTIDAVRKRNPDLFGNE